MIDPITLVSTASTSFIQANEIIKALLNLKVDSETLGKITSLQSLLANAQTSQLALLDEKSSLIQAKHNLEEDIARIETWTVESKRYVLQDVGDGHLAYVLKESEAGGEPPHWLCTTCYNKSQKSILIRGKPGSRDMDYRCHNNNCSTVIFVNYQNKPDYTFIKDGPL